MGRMGCGSWWTGVVVDVVDVVDVVVGVVVGDDHFAVTVVVYPHHRQIPPRVNRHLQSGLELEALWEGNGWSSRGEQVR